MRWPTTSTGSSSHFTLPAGRSARSTLVFMRILEIAPAWFPVPPRGYGGIELVVSVLADGLLARGHDATLVASGGSITKARLVSPLVEAPEPARIGNVGDDVFHALSSYLEAVDQPDG